MVSLRLEAIVVVVAFRQGLKLLGCGTAELPPYFPIGLRFVARTVVGFSNLIQLAIKGVGA